MKYGILILCNRKHFQYEKEDPIMSAVLGAFVQYIITFILLVAAAAGGIFCGKKLRTKKNMESNTAGTENTSGK